MSHSLLVENWKHNNQKNMTSISMNSIDRQQKTASTDLLADVRQLITDSKQQVATVVNSTMTLLYWQIGKRISSEVLNDNRAEYGKQIVSKLATHLRNEFGKGWSEQHLRHCLRIAEAFPEKEILYAVSRELSWTHLRTIMYLDTPIKRNFYIEVCKLEKWSTRTLQDRVQSMLFERTAISKKPEEQIQQELDLLKHEQKLSPDLVFKDPYFLDFLGLQDTFSEKDLEGAILVELQKFIIELGTDFAFLARQKRITIDEEDYYLDLLFFHRRLKCLVAIDLKLGKFKAAFKGQMELYLRWLEKYEQMEGENPPIGLILCAGANKEHIEFMQLEQSNIKVAEYMTHLPELEVLEQKLHMAIEVAKQKQSAQTP